MKKTKIIATYGPAVSSSSSVKQLIESGVNLFRINCSHGSEKDFSKAVTVIRQGIKGATFPVGILFDISGPKLRLDRFEGELAIKEGEKLTLTTGQTDIAERTIAVNHPGIISSVKKNERLFIDDGNLIFEIIKAEKKQIVVEAKNDGVVLPGKGINLPDTDIKIATISEKDKKDIQTAAKLKADYIALSFVRSGDDIIEARKLVKKYGGDQSIIAKLEKREAIESLDDIMLLADGVMVARGDLGVEMPFSELPNLQKEIIKLANYHHKPVIVATQMLESMRFSPRATRAEVNDIATAVFDFVDAVMLSAETATGKFPFDAVTVMSKVIEATERVSQKTKIDLEKHFIRSAITQAIAGSVSTIQKQLEAKVIFAFTTSGYTATLISNLFPPQPIIALTSNDRVLTKMSLLRSVYSVKASQPSSFKNIMTTVNEKSKKYKLAREKEMVLITGGAPFGSNAGTNFMLIHKLK